jgi:hypothetical protein
MSIIFEHYKQLTKIGTNTARPKILGPSVEEEAAKNIS